MNVEFASQQDYSRERTYRQSMQPVNHAHVSLSTLHVAIQWHFAGGFFVIHITPCSYNSRTVCMWGYIHPILKHVKLFTFTMLLWHFLVDFESSELNQYLFTYIQHACR